jgi:hypothetical protein
MKKNLTSLLIKPLERFRSSAPLKILVNSFEKKDNPFNKVTKKLTKYDFYSYVWNVECNNLWNNNVLDNVDMLSLLTDKEMHNLKTNPRCFWIFDYSLEGTSYRYFNWFKYITESATRHNVPFNKIFFVSSNLCEQQGYDSWCLENNVTDKFNILILNYWTTMFIDPAFMDNSPSIDQTAVYLKNNNEKYFLCLNRRVRDFRIQTTFLLHQSRVFDKGLISADRLADKDILNFRWRWGKESSDPLDNEQFTRYVKSLPWILDRTDFEVNWANTNPSDLFQQTFFSSVSETLGDTMGKTSMFYSEKTFKPMLYNHPIVIFGQQDINKNLAIIGFKPYNKHFNLDFDYIENNVDRIKGQILEIERICDFLDSKKPKTKIEWLMQDVEVLKHNKQEILTQTFNKKQLKTFLYRLENN